VAAANGQHQGLPTVKGADRRPQAGLQLPELHPSPSVASAPCSGRSGSAVARGITGTTLDMVLNGVPNTMQLTCHHNVSFGGHCMLDRIHRTNRTQMQHAIAYRVEQHIVACNLKESIAMNGSWHEQRLQQALSGEHCTWTDTVFVHYP